MAETIQPGECIEKIMNAFAQIGHELTNKQQSSFFNIMKCWLKQIR